jgi:predicted transcriptional regulator
MSTLKVGISSYENMKARTMAIARGEYKPKHGEPKVWFTSMGSFSRVLSDRNRALLELIAEAQPESIAELASLSGRAKSNLSRTLRTLEKYGLVHLKEGKGGKVSPRVPYTDIVLDMPIGDAFHS